VTDPDSHILRQIDATASYFSIRQFTPTYTFLDTDTELSIG